MVGDMLLHLPRFCVDMLSIEEMVAKIFATRRITRTDQHILMSMFADGNISANDQMLINRIYDALNQGRLKVVE